MIKKSKKHFTTRITLFFMRQILKKWWQITLPAAFALTIRLKELQGILVLLPTHPRTLEIVNIAVSEESRGRGIGQVIHFAIDFAKRKV